MGSRFGSIAILIIIAAIIGAAGVIIYRLGLLGGDDGDVPPVVVSIEDGALLLLGEPQNLTVSVASGTPITTINLLVDGSLLAEAIPVYSADRGAYLGSLVWTPQQLGFADLRIVAVDEQGREAVRTLRVEVTDDDARIAAALRLEVLGLAPNQQLIAREAIRVALRASGAQAIARFEMLVDGKLEATIAPVLGEDGAYIASIDWTPFQTGDVEVEFRVVDAGDRTESRILRVTILEPGTVPGAASTDAAGEPQVDGDDAQSDAGGRGAVSVDTTSGEPAALIVAPTDGDDFRLTPDLTIDVELLSQNTGPLASVLLYVTPVAPDGTLGRSNLMFSAADSLPATGEYRETVKGLERWITGAGRYELQLVVFAADERRFDHRIVIRVIQDSETDADEEADDTGEEAEQAGDADEDQDDVDLALIDAVQPDQNPERVNVSIRNLGSAPVERARVRISLTDSSDGAVISEALVTLSLGPNESANIPLDFTLDRDTNALVVLESSIDADTSNNTLQVMLNVPEVEQEQAQPAEEADEVADEEQAEQEAQQEPEADDEPQPTQPQPDLAFHEVVFNDGGYALITIVNQGDAPVSSIRISVRAHDGTEIERIVRAPSAQPLPPDAAEILVSASPLDGLITFVLDPDDEVAESDESNNLVTIGADE